MRGLSATAPLKLGHPGLGTTATRIGERLIIQNDIGTTDAHVLVAHVENRELSFTYTDIHRTRAQFFQDLFEPLGLQWSVRGATTPTGFETRMARVTAADVGELESLLTFLGSRLVFLIDWNKARKALQTFVERDAAIGLLAWAASKNLGHRAFLELGGVDLVLDEVNEHGVEEAVHLHYGNGAVAALGAARLRCGAFGRSGRPRRSGEPGGQRQGARHD